MSPTVTQEWTDQAKTWVCNRDRLRANRERHIGRWIALDAGVLVAEGASAREVRQSARKQGVELPLIPYVEPIGDRLGGGMIG